MGSKHQTMKPDEVDEELLSEVDDAAFVAHTQREIETIHFGIERLA